MSGPPFSLWGLARAFWLAKEVLPQLLHSMSGGWEERGAIAVACPPSSSSSPLSLLPFLSCLLLWPEEMEWAGVAR